VASPTSRALVLMAGGRELGRVVKDRYLIGRGKHCDLVIHSGKVSREHAAITREGADYFIADLGSSNGTWFGKRRITRRQIQEGDEYYISAEKLSCSFR
jgi:pSer/pThr/pTyr-binding forkhead associated (FHA) protein